MFVDISSLTMTKIQIFIAAARSENFTVAAETMHITQPLVSRTISQMEEKFGFPLFIRENRKVKLTASGKILLENFENINLSLCRAIDMAEEAYRGGYAGLSIADNRDTDKSTYFQPILEMFSKKYPDVQLKIIQEEMSSSIQGVISNSVDVAFTVSGELPRLNNNNLRYEHFMPVPVCLCVGKGSPFYDRDSVTMEELAGIPLIMIDHTDSCNYNEYVMSLFNSKGVKPIAHTYVQNTASLLYMIGRIPGVAVISNRYFDIHKNPETHAIPIDGITSSLVVFRNNTNSNPYTAKFLEVVREYFREK